MLSAYLRNQLKGKEEQDFIPSQTPANTSETSLIVVIVPATGFIELFCAVPLAMTSSRDLPLTRHCLQAEMSFQSAYFGLETFQTDRKFTSSERMPRHV